MNNVSLVGRITHDLEMKILGDDKQCTKFNLAVDRYLGNAQKDEKKSEGKQIADFPRIVAWGKIADNCCKYLTKGALISITGRVSTNRFEKEDGEISYITEIVAEKVQFLESQHTDSKQT